MKRKISGIELMLFLTRFRLWDAYLEGCSTIVDGIEFRMPGYGCDECSYTLHKNGDIFKEYM